MSWIHIEQRILQLLQAESTKGVFCLLGPKSSGKSDSLISTFNQAKELGVPAAYLDARECVDLKLDPFFNWIIKALQSLGWPLPPIRSPRLDFVPALLATATNLKMRSLLIIDHVEFLSDENAHALVSTLREYQEKVADAGRKQVLCVIAGRISMVELRRRADSPTLQFDFETLPPGSILEHGDQIMKYFADRQVEVEPAALTKLAKYTGGEKAFIYMLAGYLENPVREESVDFAVRRLVSEVNYFPYLLELAQFYWIDHELQRSADLLLGGRTVNFGDGSGGPRDIDVLQLRGALIVRSKYPFPYEFRNGIVRSLFESLSKVRRENPHDAVGEHPFQLGVQGDSSWQNPQNLEEWRSALKHVWQVLLGKPEEISISFVLHSKAVWSEEEEWVKSIPNASCRIISGRPLQLLAAIQLRGGWSLVAKIKPGPGLDSSVRCRHRVECWLSFLVRGAEHTLLFYQAEVGEQELIRRHERQTGPQNRRVFIVHGRNLAKRRAIVELLQAVNLEPLDWNKARALTRKNTPTVFEIIEAGMSNAQACLILLSGDDEARLRKGFRLKDDEDYEHKLTPQARANVIFEAGMALARYPRRTILVQFGQIRPFSDLRGFWILRYQDQDDLSFREELIHLLKEGAHCPVDDSKPLWKTAGMFRAKTDVQRVRRHGKARLPQN